MWLAYLALQANSEKPGKYYYLNEQLVFKIESIYNLFLRKLN